MEQKEQLRLQLLCLDLQFVVFAAFEVFLETGRGKQTFSRNCHSNLLSLEQQIADTVSWQKSTLWCASYQ